LRILSLQHERQDWISRVPRNSIRVVCTVSVFLARFMSLKKHFLSCVVYFDTQSLISIRQLQNYVHIHVKLLSFHNILQRKMNRYVTANWQILVNSVRLSWFILISALFSKFNKAQLASHKDPVLQCPSWKRLESRHNFIMTFVSDVCKECANMSSSGDFGTACRWFLHDLSFSIAFPEQ
jgi:hypothetical protein